MEELFSRILNMSLTGSIVILFVLAARLFLRRSPKIYAYILWAVVLFRLLCPISLSSSVSLLGWLQPEVKPSAYVTNTVSFLSAESAVPQVQQPATPKPPAEQGASAKASEKDYMDIAARIWSIGVLAMVLYSAEQYFQLKRRLVGASPYRGDVYLADYIESPFVIGILRPKAYLPSSIPKQERRFIIAHERQHIRRGDHVWKMLGYIALCIHWFNPLVWTAFILAGRDMEMSCDEAVIRLLGENIRADYSQALLRLATHRRIPAGLPLAFGEGDTKSRVLNMARWKKPRVWASTLCIVLCFAILAACGLNPQKNTEDISITGPEEVRFGNLTFALPAGCTYTQSGQEGSITDGTRVLGGVRVFPISETQSFSDWEWLHTLDLQEWKDDTLGYYAEGTVVNCTVEFFSDVPPGTETTLHRIHHLRMDENAVEINQLYDLWFDQLTDVDSIQYEIVNSVRFGSEAPAANSSALPYQIQSLPEGITQTTETDGSILFIRESSVVGGIVTYPIPENAYDPYDEYFLWLEDIGIPDYKDSRLSFSGGITNAYGGWNALFVSADPSITVKRSHHFVPVGNLVYDFWVEETLLDASAIYALEDAVHFTAPAPIEQSLQTDSDTAFAKCKAVMDALEWSPYHITADFQYETQTERSYSMDYYANDKGWFLTVPHPAGKEQKAVLFANGQIFTGKGEDRTGSVIWETGNSEETHPTPFLSGFNFVQKYVDYLDTFGDKDGEWIVFQVNLSDYEATDASGDYLIEFYFDSDGNFVKVRIHVNSFEEDAYIITESVVTTDPELISSEISKAYQQAATH